MYVLSGTDRMDISKKSTKQLIKEKYLAMIKRGNVGKLTKTQLESVTTMYVKIILPSFHNNRKYNIQY